MNEAESAYLGSGVGRWGGGGGVKWRMIFIIDLMETSGRIVVEAAATSFALLQLMRSWLEELIMNIVIAMASMTRMMI